MPNGGQADVTMLGVSAEGAGLTKENFNFPLSPQSHACSRKISFTENTRAVMLLSVQK